MGSCFGARNTVYATFGKADIGNGNSGKIQFIFGDCWKGFARGHSKRSPPGPQGLPGLIPYPELRQTLSVVLFVRKTELKQPFLGQRFVPQR